MLAMRPSARRAAAILFLWSAFLTTEGAVNYKYLGCFADNSQRADITGLDGTVSVEDFSFDWCMNMCQGEGYPYAGIKDARKCSCGYTYGHFGTSNACNYSCQRVIPCGGIGANDLFYTIEIDSTSESLRSDYVYTTEMTFDDARSVCTKNEGDILPIYMSSQWPDVKSLLNDAGVTTGKVWIGLRKINDASRQYTYTDRSKPSFTSSSYSNWVETETKANPCVAVNVEDGTWESTSCTAQYPFVCHQQPPPDAAPTDSSQAGDDGSGDEGSGFDMSQLSLYIVLPLFGFCYGGSCLMYCIHKIYKALKRKKRQKMLLAKLDEAPDGQNAVHRIEYEPHNKPKLGSAGDGGSKLPPPLVPPPPPPAPPSSAGSAAPPRYTPHPKPQSVRPFSASRRSAVHPIMGPPPLFKDPTPPPLTASSTRSSRTPIEELRISPRGEPEGEQAKEEPESQTARDVHVEMPLASADKQPSPPPVVTAGSVSTAETAIEAMKSSSRSTSRSHSAMSKTELRRQKLLKKALHEARERRRKESEAGGATTPAQSRDEESPDGSQWVQKSKRRAKSPRYGDDPDSGDSTVNLLSDTERVHSLDPNEMGRDPTTMSIQEILRMKVAMNKNRRRPRKPISA